jgi:glycosyltransferase involved in cell wall biosynthesis
LKNAQTLKDGSKMEDEYPLVSAIMLAGKSNITDILCAIQCFNKQSYPYKELIIINNAKTQFEASSLELDANENVFIIDTPTELTAGMARNYGIKAASGRILAQFDSDYWHSPDRLSTQISAMVNNESHICMLSDALSFSYLSGIATIISNEKSAILGTMVYIRPQNIDYPPYNKYEEFGILSKMIESGMKPISINNPDLCCKLITSDAHEDMINNGLNDDQLSLVKSIVEERSMISANM